jgi:selenocysteine-specific elongation factor
VVKAARAASTVLIEPAPWIVSRGWMKEMNAELVRVTREYHFTAPLEAGISKADLRSRVLPNAPPAVFEALLKECKEFAIEAEHVRLKNHLVALSAEEDNARLAILKRFEDCGLSAPPVAEVLEQSGVDAVRARTILQMLLRERILVKINDDFILHATAISKIREILSVHRHSPFSVPDFKSWTGVSRKYAVPLLEYCDRQRMTLRRGDQRTIL